MAGQRRRCKTYETIVQMPINDGEMQDNGTHASQERKCAMRLTATPLHIVTPVTLEGSVIRLEPIRREHAELFWQAAKDALDDIFQWIPYRMNTGEDFEHVVEKALAEQERGDSVVFATVERKSRRVIGGTRYMNIDRVNRRVEIRRGLECPRHITIAPPSQFRPSVCHTSPPPDGTRPLSPPDPAAPALGWLTRRKPRSCTC